MVLRFMGNLIGVKANQAVTAGVEALIRWDPKSATEAELRTMEQHLDALGVQVDFVAVDAELILHDVYPFS